MKPQQPLQLTITIPSFYALLILVTLIGLIPTILLRSDNKNDVEVYKKLVTEMLLEKKVSACAMCLESSYHLDSLNRSDPRCCTISPEGNLDAYSRNKVIETLTANR